jgi:ferrochelatase
VSSARRSRATWEPGVEWTQPDIEAVVDEIDAETIVVDAVSFMHEQSETLAELDDELRERVEERGIHFHRVPIPYLASPFIGVLADLVKAAIEPAEATIALHQCRCKPTPGTVCTNARD